MKQSVNGGIALILVSFFNVQKSVMELNVGFLLLLVLSVGKFSDISGVRLYDYLPGLDIFIQNCLIR